MHMSRHLGNKLEYHAAQTARPTNPCRLHNSIATSTAISQCDPIWQETQLQQVFNAIDGYVLRLGEGGTLVAVTLVRSNTSKFSWGKLAANHPFYDDPSPFYKRFTPISLPPKETMPSICVYRRPDTQRAWRKVAEKHDLRGYNLWGLWGLWGCRPHCEFCWCDHASVLLYFLLDQHESGSGNSILISSYLVSKGEYRWGLALSVCQLILRSAQSILFTCKRAICLYLLIHIPVSLRLSSLSTTP